MLMYYLVLFKMWGKVEGLAPMGGVEGGWYLEPGSTARSLGCPRGWSLGSQRGAARVWREEDKNGKEEEGR